MSDEIKLGRVGHYSIDETCWTAMIVNVLPKAFDTVTGELPPRINVAGWDHEGNAFSRRGVEIGPVDHDVREGVFHLNRDCPQER